MGFVVPTLGNRISYLEQLLNSLDTLKYKYQIVVVGPTTFFPIFTDRFRYNSKLIFLQDPLLGLPAAINYGFKKLNSTYWNWIGDDDLIEANGVSDLIFNFRSNPSASFIYGKCMYIDQNTKEIFINNSSKFASSLIKYGPNLIPQPSCIFRSDLTKNIGGLSDRYKYAFDQDFIHRMLLINKPLYHSVLASKYRWHTETLTNKNWASASKESLEIRLNYSRSFSIRRILIYLFFIPTMGMQFLSRTLFRLKSTFNQKN